MIFDPVQKVHVGKIIEQKFKESGLTKKAFADKINLSQRHLYTIFSKNSVDTGLLMRISEVLNYDFFIHFTKSKSIAPNESNIEEAEIQLVIRITRNISRVSILEQIDKKLKQLI